MKDVNELLLMEKWPMVKVKADTGVQLNDIRTVGTKKPPEMT